MDIEDAISLKMDQGVSYVSMLHLRAVSQTRCNCEPIEGVEYEVHLDQLPKGLMDTSQFFCY